MGFAACEAAQQQLRRRHGGLERPGRTWHLVAWMKVVVYGAAERWTDGIDQAQELGNAGTAGHGRCGARGCRGNLALSSKPNV